MNSTERLIAFGAVATAVAYFMRNPIALLQGAAGLLVVFAGFYFYEHSDLWRAPKNQVGPETHAQPAPIAPAQSAGAARQEPRSIASNARNDAEAAAPVKTPPQTRSIVAARDPALDSWFIKSYLRCWTPPATLPQGEKYAAQVRVVHRNDGSLAAAPLLVNPPSDPAWRAYADSALRAVTKCNPLQVPPQYLAHFDQWRKMALHFSPDSAVE
jgi:colicin import membrane protein